MKLQNLLCGIISVLSITLLPMTAVADQHHELPDVIIKTHKAPHSEINTLSKYCLHPMDDKKSSHIINIHPELEEWLKADITTSMQGKGFVEVANYQCELEIGYAIHIRNQAMLHALRINQMDSIANRLTLIPERTFVIHAYDLHRSRTLWIGTAEEVIFDDDRNLQSSEVIKSRLNKAINMMFNKFP